MKKGAIRRRTTSAQRSQLRGPRRSRLYGRVPLCVHTDFIQADRINSGLKSPKRAGRTSRCLPIAGKLQPTVVQPGLLTRERRTRGPGCMCILRADSSRCKTEHQMSSFLHLLKESSFIQSCSTLSTPIGSLFYAVTSPLHIAVWEIYPPAFPG